MGWRLGRQYWGRGIAQEAGQLVKGLAARLGFSFAAALINSDNTRSIKLARNWGFSLVIPTSALLEQRLGVTGLVRGRWNQPTLPTRKHSSD
jgi:L-amino acid N-acyltransferase YncA